MTEHAKGLELEAGGAERIPKSSTHYGVRSAPYSQRTQARCVQIGSIDLPIWLAGKMKLNQSTMPSGLAYIASTDYDRLTEITLPPPKKPLANGFLKDFQNADDCPIG